MQPVHIIGNGGCGKTTLIVDLIPELLKAGARVGTLKHSTHIHELDKPGKDSFLHRKAGAAPVTMMTKNMSAIYLPRTDQTDPVTLLDTFYRETDVVLIEGWISGPFPKIEFYRESVNKPPLFPHIDHVRALVCDNFKAPADMKVFSRKEVDKIAAFILTLAK